jgi:sulfotransferase
MTLELKTHMTNKKIHFISGLPRSGSTLLAAILRQNPRFHAAMTSPVGSLFTSMLNTMSSKNEAAVFITDQQRAKLVKGVFNNFYDEFGDQEVIFDTNRIWTAKLPALKQIMPDAKVICCVRNVAWIMDSFEKMIRKNPLQISKMFGDADGGTVYTRVEAMAHPNRIVGFAWSALKEAYYGEEASSMLLVEYDLLASSPEKTLKLIYQFIGEDYFDHDFENIDYNEEQFDENLGLPGLHKVRKKVEFQQRNTILPPDLFEKFDGMSFWKDQTGSRANVISKTKTDNEE